MINMKKVAVTVAAVIASATIWTSAASAEQIVVEKGDNLWNLAKEHETTVETLMALNDLNSTVIYPGQVLETELKHIVVKGDTLWGLAKYYGVSIDKIKERNKLTSDLIIIGQVLTIPNANVTKVQYTNGANKSQSSVQQEPVQQEQESKKVEQPAEVQSEPVQKEAEKQQVESVPAKEEVTQNEPAVNKEVQPQQQEETKQEGNEQQQKAPVQEPKQEVQEQPAAAPTKSAEAQPQPKQEPKQEQASNTMTVTSTAYTVKSAGGSGVTATGIDLNKNPNAKVIAVDPSVIPLGTKVYVDGYGEAIAGDTGSAIKGKKIDVYFPSDQQARNWGVRTVNIKILD